MTSQNNVLEGFRERHLCENVSSPFSGGVLSEAETSDRVGLGRNIPLSTSVGHVGGVATNLNENGTLHGNGRVVSPEQKIQNPIMMEVQASNNMRQDVALDKKVPISSFRTRGGEECNGAPHQSNLLHSDVAILAAGEPNDPHDTEMDYENEEYILQLEEWIKRKLCEYIPPAPRYLLITDMGSNKFSKEPAWSQMFLLDKTLQTDTSKFPIMKKFFKDDKSYMSLEIPDPEANKELIERLLKTERIGRCKVKITKDPFKNTTKGVVTDADAFFEDTADVIVKNLLQSKGVIDIRRLGKSSSYLLTFDHLLCPTELKFPQIGRSFKVREYVPPPLRCFHCQRYDHLLKNCRGRKEPSTPPICARCGEEGHSDKTFNQGRVIGECSKEPRCPNCKGTHVAGSKNCPTQQEHKKVCELMVYHKITKQEAKKRVFGDKNKMTASKVVAATSNPTPINEATKNLDNELKKLIEEKMNSIEKMINQASLMQSNDINPNNVVNNTEKNENAIVEEKIAVAIKQAEDRYKVALQESENRNKTLLQSQQHDYDKRLKDLEDKNTNLIKRIDELSETNKYLQEQNNVYQQKSENDRQTIENLRKQLAEYKKKSESISPPRKNTKFVDSSEKPKVSAPQIDLIQGSTNPVPKYSSKPGVKPTPLGKHEKSTRNSGKQNRQ